MNPWNLFLKRSIDLFSAVFLLLFLFSWVCPLIALLIKLDSKGPVFFFQRRIKRNGKVFTCIKFRTMIVNGDADLLPAFIDDNRITTVGKYLRICHLDELPQLINVLSGEMSLIGPRPYMVSEHARYASELLHFSYRHTIKPGITGFAQVLGHVGFIENPAVMNERLKKDLFYIHNWSVLLDMKILFLTILRILGWKR